MGSLIKERNKKLKKSIYLRNINPDNVSYEKMQEIRKEQDKLYREWKFQSEVSKAMQETKKEEEK